MNAAAKINNEKMETIMKMIAFLLLVALLGGCASFTSPARKHSLEANNYWMDYDASRRGALVLQKPGSSQNTGGWVVCSEPAPDVALDLVNKFEASLSKDDKKSADVKGEITISAIKLAERTQMISYLRESLFRLCEMSINKDFGSEELKDMYMKVQETAIEIVKNDKAEIKMEIAKAEAEKAATVRAILEKGNTVESITPLFSQ